MKNCRDCKHHSIMDASPDAAYHLMCDNPRLLPLIVPSENLAVRCNETREFNFACGIEAKWFEQRGV